MEVIGTYDPIPKPPKEGEGKAWKDIKLDTARAKYWLGVGAQPSDTAWRLLSLVGYFNPCSMASSKEGFKITVKLERWRTGQSRNLLSLGTRWKAKFA